MESQKNKYLPGLAPFNKTTAKLQSKVIELEQLTREKREEKVVDSKINLYHEMMDLLSCFDEEKAVDDRNILGAMCHDGFGIRNTESDPLYIEQRHKALFKDLFLNFNKREIPIDTDMLYDSDGEESERMIRKFKRIRFK